MTDRLTIALAQTNPTVGDLEGNFALIRDVHARAAKAGADLVLFSEMVVAGYPPEDLVKKPFFLDKVEAVVHRLAELTYKNDTAMIVGAPWRVEGKLFNAALLLDGGEIAAVRAKHELPNYGVFDEKRLFDAGDLTGPVVFRGVALGLMICEDMWYPDVTECQQECGADILLVSNGSPFDRRNVESRMQSAVARVTESGLPMVYVNQVGGQDELVFDGASFVLNADRGLVLQLPSFEAGFAISDWQRGAEGWQAAAGEMIKPPEDMETIYRAMVVGLRDYVTKNGFPGVVLGMSGGIDSALSAAVAVDALGADKVHCVMMPSPYTSHESLEDAAEAVKLLGCRLDEINIGPAMTAFDEMLKPLFGDRNADITEENIQSRARGLTLMAISNKFGKMVLTTGNKSEMSVGYATLYGDMCGGYSVLKDIYKMDVFRLCRWRNEGKPQAWAEILKGPDGPVMPERIITKPPSAELRPDQKDEDSLPPYEVLDDILECLIEHEMGVGEITARGHAPETVQRVWKLLDLAEYKRRQAPPGVKVTSRAFGKDRRYPITNAFRKII
ncbi:NAD+ synthase [Aestuariispira insulae]|uniref:Glutamine-dependent NAD(+) synthetase n=1 Tax=Aestuariispira insulae TaxID=1461337 RepID=A0A3D9HWQ0_9PROT|nr:NAD+ synthase [Aestuariispira insulae]RED53932.1 NH(3)-dependent NAD(+) synthetase [Aestuariispira insulae]